MPVLVTLSGSAPNEFTVADDHEELVGDIDAAQQNGDWFYSATDAQTGKRVSIDVRRIKNLVEI